MIQLNDFIDLKKLEKKELVGEGSFGNVYKVIEESSGKIYAAKVSKNKLEDLEPDLITNYNHDTDKQSIHYNFNGIFHFLQEKNLTFVNYRNPFLQEKKLE
ncbi:hypothetical protein M9Y10_033891 [Tritrichomonas musculus]|uniref:Protein kinase domain-containing protein n=1 Tax=Tritrichomonas musculus TaxID=1915356 RepID=A0ABR2KDE5_9EUKA